MKNYALTPLTNKLYRNPIPIENMGNTASENIRINGDPYVIKFNGQYFCYSTGMQSVNLLYSEDMVHYNHLGSCLEDPGMYNFWAPCVIYLNGKFYMYYSSNPIGDEDDHAHCLRVAVSDSPYGPFVFQKQMLDLFSIDPHVIKDNNGKLFMFYSANNYSGTDRNFTGTIVLLDEMSDPYTLVGSPMPIVLPSIKEEMFMENRFGDGRDWYTIEGAYYFRKRDNEYLMYSANAFLNPSYFIGYATAKNGMGLTEGDWSKYPNNTDYDPFICQNSEVMGTGHNSVVKAPNNVDDWIVYHGNDRKDIDKEIPTNREMRIDPLLFGKDKLYTIAPSSTWQDAPAQPLYRNLYKSDMEKEIGVFGNWHVDRECLLQDNRNIIAALYLKDICTENYILEVNTRWHPFHLGGRYGVFAAFKDNQNNVQVIFNEGECSVELYATLNGCTTQISSIKLENKFDFAVYHKLTIKRTGDMFFVYVDDVFRLKGVYSIGRASVGLVSYYTSVAYASLEITEYLELNKDNAPAFAAQLISECTSLEKNWVVSNDSIIGYAIDSKKLLIHQKQSRYRFSVNFVQQVRKKNSDSGIYAAYCDADNYITLLANDADHKITIQICKNGLLQQKTEYGLESDYHTVTVKRIDQKIIILLGTKCVLEETTEFGNSYCGLYAGTRTEFSDIELLTL